MLLKVRKQDVDYPPASMICNYYLLLSWLHTMHPNTIVTFYPYFGRKTESKAKLEINVVNFTSICIVPSHDDGM